VSVESAKRLEEMRAQVTEELAHIPRGDKAQNLLRQFYWAARMSSLKTGNKTAKQVLEESIASVRSVHAYFKANFEKGFFKGG